ncbi:MAG TPA: hypothetical protein VJN93_13700 [Candidatus Acidoferrum sp.]|nr:hypothetical protein [Candidatus Acidoferrum sp.]
MSSRLPYSSLLWMVAVATVAAPATQTQLPTAKEIVQRYDAALGGREAIRRHQSSTLRGYMEIRKASGEVRLEFTYFAAAPYQRLERVTLPNNAGDVLNGFDGQNAWSFDPRTGPQLFSGTERESMKRDADFYYPLTELSWFKSMKTAGAEEFEGRPCYRLHGINNWDKVNDHFYDRETGLLAGYEFESGYGPTHEIFSDYKKADGVLVPTTQTVKFKSKDGNWSVAQILHFTSVTFNDVDPSVFTPPQAVRGLLAKAKPAVSN